MAEANDNEMGPPSSHCELALNGYVIALAIVAAYAAIILLGRGRRLWKRLGLSTYGPILLWRTQRGRRTIARAAARGRFWTRCGTLASVVCLVAMVAMTTFLVWESYVVLFGAQSPDATEITLGPLGIDTIVLGVYLVVGLVVAVFVHEFLHGIMAVAQRIRLDSLGLLFLVIPLGAFVEPNDEDLEKARRTSRMRLYAAGPAANLFVALVCFVVLVGFLGPTIQPQHEGALVTEVGSDSPAEIQGLSIWSEVTDVQGVPIDGASKLRNFQFDTPGEWVQVTFIHAGEERVVRLPEGVVVTAVPEGPAYNAGIEPGRIIYSLDNIIIHGVEQFRSVTENSSMTEPVNITVLKYSYDSDQGRDWWVEDPAIREVNMTSKWVYYYKYYPRANREQYRNVSFLGVSTAAFGIHVEDMDYLPRLIAHPFPAEKGDQGVVRTILRFVALPSLGYSPVVSPATDLYQSSGVLTGTPHDLYWVLVNLFYWLFWTNLLLGVANALPALPFDGGYVLRDLLKEIANRRGDRLTGFDRTIGRKPMTDWQVDYVMWVVTAFVYLLLVVLVTWQVIGPII